MKNGRYIGWTGCLMMLLIVTTTVRAQVEEKVCKTDYNINPERVGELSVELDNISFFKDNEYAGTVMKGYSLPGMWLEPKVVYYPLKNIKLELGAHALIYSGAYKFPNYAYHDIAPGKEVNTNEEHISCLISECNWPCLV